MGGDSPDRALIHGRARALLRPGALPLVQQLPQQKPGQGLGIAVYLLGFLGAEVRVVYDGLAALTAAAEWTPAVILLDLGMPLMDGWEVARRLRREPGLKSVKLIALTGWGQLDDRERTTSAGFDHHLVKPVDVDEIEALLVSLFAQGS